MDPRPDLLERRHDLLAAKFDALFHCLDRDDNGVLTAGDFLRLAARLRQLRGWTEDEPRARRVTAALVEFWEVLVLCVDADDSVDREAFTQFKRILSAQTEEFGQAPPWILDFVTALFLALDRNGDGAIELDEYAEYLRLMGSDADAAAAFRRLDLDGNGSIEVDELERLVAGYLTSNDPSEPANLLFTGSCPGEVRPDGPPVAVPVPGTGARWRALASLPVDERERLAAACSELEVLAGATLVARGATDGAIFEVLSGRFELRGVSSRRNPVVLRRMGPGDTFGEFSHFMGRHDAEIVAVDRGRVLRVPGPTVDEAIAASSSVAAALDRIASENMLVGNLFTALVKLTGDVDYDELQAVRRLGEERVLAPGQWLMREGEVGDAWYVLTSGRLGVVGPRAGRGSRASGFVKIVRPGEPIGEMALLTDRPRSASVQALRQSSVVRFGADVFGTLLETHPAFGVNLARVVADRLASPRHKTRPEARTLAIILADDGPELEAAARDLKAALRRTGAVRILERADSPALLGEAVPRGHPPDHPVWTRFARVVDAAESVAEYVVLDAGAADDAWGFECLWRADACLFLARATAGGAAPRPDRELAACGRAQAALAARDQAPPWTLLLLHPPETRRPTGTSAWLDAGRFADHFHLRGGARDTFDRAARLVTGRAVCLALGGGGARGLAHIGVLSALEASGVAVDALAGTSIGAIFGAMYAMGLSPAEMIAAHRRVYARNPFTDYTLPLVALNRSTRRDAGLAQTFESARIEDLWRPFLAVSTDIQSSQDFVHERGSVATAAGASSSLPGLLTPIADGSRILVDGGIVNNLPGDILHDRFGGFVIGVNLDAEGDLALPPGGFPSPWKMLWHKLAPWLSPIEAPSLAHILLRSFLVASKGRQDRVRGTVDLLLEPPVAAFGMLEFGTIEPLVEAGRRHTLERLAAGVPGLKRRDR